MSLQKDNVGLILAIVFASVVISGSLVFFGMQVAGKGGPVTVAMLEQAFDSYVQKQQQKQLDSQKAQEVDKSAMVKNVKRVSKTEDHIRGNKDAKISLIEYSDFECPFCKKFHPMAEQIMAMYGNDINWVYRHYPLGFHDPLATKEAEASECVSELGGNDKFWEYADLIYERTTSNGDGLTMDNLLTMAGEVGINSDAFKNCMDSGKYLGKVQRDTAEGASAGVEGTPGNILLNNETGEAILIEGAMDVNKYFKPAIDQLLK